jgi:hypothetical protein
MKRSFVALALVAFGSRTLVAQSRVAAARVSVDTASLVLGPRVLEAASDLARRFKLRAKDEYESKEKYLNWASRRLDTLFHAVRVSCPYAGGSYDVDSRSMTKMISYDPDRGGYAIDLGTGGSEMDDAGRQVGRVILDCRTSATGEYSGSNAFGARRAVTKQLERVYEVSYESSQEIGTHIDMKFFVPYPPDSARAIRATVRGAIVFKAGMRQERPPVETETRRVAPTVSRPVDYTAITERIHCSDAMFWLYDSRTGRVLGKFDLIATANGDGA